MTERSWTLFAHLGTLLGYVVPFGNIIVPAVIYVSKKDESLEVAEHARESLNFQITFTLIILLAVLLVILLIGIALLIVLPVLQVILVIVATLKADKGQFYRYPLTIRFV